MRLADALGEQLVRALCQFKRRSLDFHCFHLTRILLTDSSPLHIYARGAAEREGGARALSAGELCVCACARDLERPRVLLSHCASSFV